MAIRWPCRWIVVLLDVVVIAVQSPSDSSQRPPASDILELSSEGHVGLGSHVAGLGSARSSLLEAYVSADSHLDFAATVIAIESEEHSDERSGCTNLDGLKTNASSFLETAVDLSEVPNVAVFQKVATKKFCKELPMKKRKVMPPQQCALLCGSDPTCRSYSVAPNADGEDEDCPMCQVYKTECRDHVPSFQTCGTPSYIFKRVPFRQMGTGFMCDGDEIHVGDEPLPVCMQKCAADDNCRSVTYVEAEARGGSNCQACHTYDGKCRTGDLWPAHQCHGGQATSFSKRRYCHKNNPRSAPKAKAQKA